MVQMTSGWAALRLAGLCLVLAASALSGCGSAPPVAPDRYFALDPRPLEGPAGPPAQAVILVNPLGARGFLGGRNIVYRTREDPLAVQRYQTLLWAEPPNQAIAAALANAVRAAGVVRFVAVPADRARPDYLLGGEVERFEHLPTEHPPRVAAAFDLALVRADDRSSLAGRRYSGEEPVDGGTPEAMADAFNRLTARLIAEAVRDLKALAPRLTPGRGKNLGAGESR